MKRIAREATARIAAGEGLTVGQTMALFAHLLSELAELENRVYFLESQ